MSTSTEVTSPPSQVKAVTTMWIGLGLSVLTMLVLALDQLVLHNLSDHLRAMYADYMPAGQDPGDTSVIAGYLYVVGIVGVLCWFLVIRAAQRGRTWARSVGTTLFVLGATLALFNLVVGEYDQTILPTPLGLVGLLPPLAGLVAVVHLWRRDGRDATGAA